MEWLSPVLMAVQVISSLSVIVLVLLQQGKGADMGSAFGSGSAGSLFGAAGAANFLSRTTKWAAIAFFASTAGLAWVSHKPDNGGAIDSGVMQGFEVPQVPGSGSVPAAPNGAVPSAPAVPNAPSSSGASVPQAAGQADGASAPRPAEPAPASSPEPSAPAAESSPSAAAPADSPSAPAEKSAAPAAEPSSQGEGANR